VPRKFGWIRVEKRCSLRLLGLVRYVEARFAPRFFGRLLAIETLAQFVVGLGAYPGLSPNPFRKVAQHAQPRKSPT